MIKKETVSGSQLVFTVVCYIESFSLITGFSFSVAGRDTWFAVITGAAVAALIFWMQLWVAKQFPGKDLMAINNCLFGKVWGRVFSILYLFYFLTLSSLNLRDMSDFVRSSILPDTPGVIAMLTSIAVCAWAVTKGMRVVLRYSTAFSILTFCALALTSIFIWGRMDWHNFLPVLDTPPIKLVQDTHLMSVIPFGTIVYQMIYCSAEEPKHAEKRLMKGFLLGGVFLLMVILRDTAVFGDMVSVLTIPSYATLRLAGFTEAFQGIDVVYATLLTLLEFFKISFLYYVVAVGTAEVLGLESYKPLVYTFGVLIVLYARILYPSMTAHNLSAQTTVPFIWTFFELVLPFISLLRLLAMRRKEKKKGESAA